jgi:hypothetical protein
MRQYGGDPAIDLRREDLIVHVRISSAERAADSGTRVRDPYVFRLDFVDYDDHAARIVLCDPCDAKARTGAGREFYPNIEGNQVFSHDSFLCMPGDRRCYEQNNHPEWKLKQHYHPDIVIGSLFALLQSPNYRGRLSP